MSQAIERHATRIWIVNVGDLKPYELNTEFFINYGWNSSRWNFDNLDTFVSLWAQREFDVPESTADEVADIMTNLTRSNNRRKPELLNGTIFSLTDYREYAHLYSLLVNRLMCLPSQSRKCRNCLGHASQCFNKDLRQPIFRLTACLLWVSASSCFGKFYARKNVDRTRNE